MSTSQLSEARSKATGFTIVETIIVLAVAGLMLSITLLAVPVLQRNSRNNQAKQEIAKILDAISRYELNHSGNYPLSTATLISEGYYKATIYPASDISIASVGAGQPDPSVDTAKVKVLNYYRCNDTGTGASSKAAGYHDTVALYGIEVSGGMAPKCMQM